MALNENDFFDEAFLARLEHLHLMAKRTARPTSGARRSRTIGDGLEFADHRAYAPGDDPRFIDWPYYARMDKLLLRMFHQHSDAEVSILLDVSASMAPAGKSEKFDYARKTAAALAYVAMGSLERVNIVPFSASLGRGLHTARGRNQVLHVLNYLTALQPNGATQLMRCSVEFARRTPAAGTVLVITDLLDCADQLSSALARLRLRGHQVTVIHLFAPEDASPKLAGPMVLKQPEKQTRFIGDITDDLLESYHNAWEQFQHRCQTICLSRESTYVSACTDVPFDKLILHSLRRAGVLAG